MEKFIHTQINSLFYGLFYLVGEQLIILAFGVEMVKAYTVSLIYIWAVVLNLLSLPLPSLIHAMGLANKAFYNQLVSTTLYTIILYLSVSIDSINGAAISMIFFQIFWSIGAIFIVVKHSSKAGQI